MNNEGSEEHINDEDKSRSKETNVHAVAPEIPGRINPMVANAEAFNDAIADPKKKDEQAWIDIDKKSQKAEREAGSIHPSKRDRGK